MTVKWGGDMYLIRTPETQKRILSFIFRKNKQLHKTGITKRQWTEEEKNIVSNLVAESDQKGETPNWEEIGKMLNRTDKSISSFAMNHLKWSKKSRAKIINL